MRRLVCLLLGVTALAGFAGGLGPPARADQPATAGGATNTPAPGVPPSNQASSGSQIGSDEGTSPLVPVVIAAGAIALLLGGAWSARRTPVAIPAPLAAVAPATAETSRREAGPGSTEPEGDTVTSEETTAAPRRRDETAAAEAALAEPGTAPPADVGARPSPDDEAAGISMATERDAFARLSSSDRSREIEALAKQFSQEPATEAPQQEVPDSQRQLEELHALGEELSGQLEQGTQRIAASQERTLRVLERAAARLEEAEARAADAEARASRAERLVELTEGEVERAHRLRETLDRIADAERRASEADARSRELFDRASSPVPPPD
jgi:hypothetical protein